MNRGFLICFLCCFFCAAGFAQQNDSLFSASAISDFSLQNTASKQSHYSLPANPSKPVLFLFLSTECPLCQNYTSTLNDLYNQYGEEVSFYGILSGSTYTEKDIADFKNDYKITFPLLVDSSEKLTRYLGATITPEAVLLNTNAELLYKGAIDNWLVSLGKKRAQVTEHFVKDALENTVHHKDIAIKRTKAIGCKLNDF